MTSVAALEEAARVAMGPDAWASLGGTDEEWTLRRNSAALRAISLSPPGERAAQVVALGTTVLGERVAMPILVGPAPFGPGARAPGQIFEAVRGAGTRMVVQDGIPFAPLVGDKKDPAFRQLYFRGHAETERTVGALVDSGVRGIFLTVDVLASPMHERETRVAQRRRVEPLGERLKCRVRSILGRERLVHTDVNDIRGIGWRHPELTWADIRRMRRYVPVPLVLKGIMTGEDAQLAAEHGADGVVVSNHGGRAQDRVPATIEVLPEVVAAVGNRVPVLVDSGFRTGRDVFKALALGAQAVLIVRPIFWGLAAMGDAGPAHVLQLFRAELEEAMRSRGCRSVAAIDRRHVHLPAA